MIHSLEIIAYLLSVAGLVILTRLANSKTPPHWAGNEIIVGVLISTFSSGVMFGATGFVINPAVTTGSFRLDILVGVVAVIGAGVVASVFGQRRKAGVVGGQAAA